MTSSFTTNGAVKQPMSPENTISQLDGKIASTQAKLNQLKLQVLNEEKKLEKFLNERRIIESALHSSSFTFAAQPHTDGVTDYDARPLALRRLSSSNIITDSPQSPPPTTKLSPPPFKNRLHAGHTPMHTGALSPSVSNMATPLAAPKAPLADLPAYSSSHRLAPVHADLPDLEDDPKLEGPLTAHDDGFLGAVTEKLEKVKSEGESEEAHTVVDPPPSTSPNTQTHDDDEANNSTTPKLLKLQTLLQGEHMNNNHHYSNGDLYHRDVERDEFQEQSDEISPLAEKVPVLEQMEGVKLKAKRSTNFGVPLGRLW